MWSDNGGSGALDPDDDQKISRQIWTSGASQKLADTINQIFVTSSKAAASLLKNPALSSKL